MKKKLIAITTGDGDGIGLEVTMKALQQLPSTKTTYLIFREKSTSNKLCWRPLPKKTTRSFHSLSEALTEAHSLKSPYRYLEILSSESPAQWVQESAQLCLNQFIQGLVTGPVSKKTFIDAQLESIGHTPLLSKICHAPHVYMGFLGHAFNVLLLTGHIPLHKVESSLTSQSLEIAFQKTFQWTREFLPPKYQNRPLGVLGLNPHNGESGLIGHFETKTLEALISKYPFLAGPLVPDVAFFKENWKKYAFFVALYHDQGLIPFKMIHSRTGGCHVTVGLPIVRTSVDHGTAKDIFAQGKAQPESMIAALKWCELLIKRKDSYNAL